MSSIFSVLCQRVMACLRKIAQKSPARVFALRMKLRSPEPNCGRFVLETDLVRGPCPLSFIRFCSSIPQPAYHHKVHSRSLVVEFASEHKDFFAKCAFRVYGEEVPAERDTAMKRTSHKSKSTAKKLASGKFHNQGMWKITGYPNGRWL